MTAAERSQLSAEQAALLAQRLRGERGRPAGTMGRAAIPPRSPGEEPVPSFAQQRLWFLEQLQPGAIAYVMPECTYRIRGPVDVSALETALRMVADRHAVLRSHFADMDGNPRVVVGRPDRILLQRLDISGADDPVARAWDMARGAALTPFDLDTGPLLRATLLQLGRDDAVLQTTVHHSVFDGSSIPVFEQDLTAAYAAVRAGTAPAWTPLPVSYADFAAWQRENLTEDVLGDHIRFWRDALAGAPPALELPTDHQRPPVPSYRRRCSWSRWPPTRSCSAVTRTPRTSSLALPRTAGTWPSWSP
jgi:hypothetical protein